MCSDCKTGYLNITAPGNYAGDSVLDSPTNYSNGTVGGNYATFNPLSWAMSSNGGVNPGALISDGNLRSDGNRGQHSHMVYPIQESGTLNMVFGDNTNIGLFKPVYDYDSTIKDSTGNRRAGMDLTVLFTTKIYVTDSTAPILEVVILLHLQLILMLLPSGIIKMASSNTQPCSCAAMSSLQAICSPVLILMVVLTAQ